MGRSALDEEAIRLIEERNPDVEFDWTRILKGQGGPESEARSPQELDLRRRPQRFRDASPVAPAAQTSRVPDPSPALPAEPAEFSAESTVIPVEPIEVRLDPVLVNLEPVMFVPASPDAQMSTDKAERDQPVTAALARLGSEGLSRLRARHAEVLARISEKITDRVRRDELKAEAERLNPDTWVTEVEVVAGLEQYETVFESLRGVVGRRRKRRRRRGAAGAATGELTEAPADANTSDDDDSSAAEDG